MRRAGVAPLVRVDENLRRIEQVEVLGVVPVGVGEHDRVDVSGREAAPLQCLEQYVAPADVTDIEECARLPLDEDQAAEAEQTLPRSHPIPIEENVDFYHASPPVRSVASAPARYSRRNGFVTSLPTGLAEQTKPATRHEA